MDVIVGISRVDHGISTYICLLPIEFSPGFMCLCVFVHVNPWVPLLLRCWKFYWKIGSFETTLPSHKSFPQNINYPF